MFAGESRRAYRCIIPPRRGAEVHFIYRFLTRSTRFFDPVVLHASRARARARTSERGLPTFSAANICLALARGLCQANLILRMRTRRIDRGRDA